VTSPSITKLKCPLSAAARVVAYARDSGGEEQERSVDQQIALYSDYAKHFNLQLLETFTDRARPGSSTVHRDGFERMMNFLHQDPAPAEGLLLWKINRFARNLIESQYYIADLRRRGYTLIFIADDIPDAGDLTPIFETLLQWKAQRDLKDISTDSKRGLADLVTMKKSDGAYEGFMPGTPPTCFKREAVTIGTRRSGAPRKVSRWVPDLLKWERGKQAWAMRAAGMSLDDIHRATHLFKKRSGYTGFFKNPIYIGRLEFGELTLENFVTPLATQEQWDKVQSARVSRLARGGSFPAGKHPRQRSDNPYIVSGLLKCKHCGAQMVGNTTYFTPKKKKPWRHYICINKERDTSSCPSSRLDMNAVHRAVRAAFAEKIFTPQTLAAVYQHYITGLIEKKTATPRQLAALQKELTDLNRAIKNLLDLVERGDAGADAAARLRQRESERGDLLAIIARASRQPDPAKLKPPTPELLQKICAALNTQLNDADPTRVKALLKQYVIEIIADKNGGIMHYHLPPAFKTPPPEDTSSGGGVVDIDSAPGGTQLISATITLWWTPA
jgi:DNA invertase Pin-like site-specific DNA recombinase